MYDESTQGAGFLAKYCSEIKAILRRNKRITEVVLQQHACVCTGEVSGEPHAAFKSSLKSPRVLRLGQQRDPNAQHLPWDLRCFFKPALEAKVLIQGLVGRCRASHTEPRGAGCLPLPPASPTSQRSRSASIF